VPNREREGDAEGVLESETLLEDVRDFSAELDGLLHALEEWLTSRLLVTDAEREEDGHNVGSKLAEGDMELEGEALVATLADTERLGDAERLGDVLKDGVVDAE
jgi:pantothenate kinase